MMIVIVIVIVTVIVIVMKMMWMMIRLMMAMRDMKVLIWLDYQCLFGMMICLVQM